MRGQCIRTLVLAAALGGCGFEVSVGGAQLTCSEAEPECPSGMLCIDDVCRTSFAVADAAPLPLPPDGQPVDCHQLTAIVRDFSIAHPDFEDASDGVVVTGLVEPTIEADGVPVYAADAPVASITSAETFAGWYVDDEGTNLLLTVPFTGGLTGGSWSFGSPSYFPIDGLGFGNEGLEHNYHFTTELRASFVYSSGQTMTFTQSDDLWVFVDGRLAVDAGGIRSSSTRSVPFAELGLVPGERYDLDVFAAERRTPGSTFVVSTSIDCLLPR